MLIFLVSYHPQRATPVGYVVGLGESFAMICCGSRNSYRVKRYARAKVGRCSPVHWRICYKGIHCGGHDGCDHTSTNAPDPIRTPKLSVLGRE
ncbi:protein NRT1/ PTR FAMILY 6.1 [Salvia divinorum]|uniref:Protein NRT1/ PTR FAMILY 6.1 n=1 Tax=Salvia divinorum TaxID=28513 RepID=A0ABD1HL89_SALDI